MLVRVMSLSRGYRLWVHCLHAFIDAVFWSTTMVYSVTVALGVLLGWGCRCTWGLRLGEHIGSMLLTCSLLGRLSSLGSRWRLPLSMQVRGKNRPPVVRPPDILLHRSDGAVQSARHTCSKMPGEASARSHQPSDPQRFNRTLPDVSCQMRTPFILDMYWQAQNGLDQKVRLQSALAIVEKYNAAHQNDKKDEEIRRDPDTG